MKFLKIIGSIILIVIVTGAVLGLMKSKEYRVERSTDIFAPKHIVFNHIQYLGKWDAWSPWKERDTSLKATVEGVDGTSGAVYTWKGDAELSGSGYSTITSVVENEKLDFEIVMTVPWKRLSGSYLTVEENKDGSTNTTWVRYGEYNFIGRIFSIFYDMDATVGADFERGLEKLKDIAEAEEVEDDTPKMKIAEEVYPQTSYLTLRIDSASFDQIKSSEFIGKQFGELMGYISENNVVVVGMPATLYYTWDTISKISNVAYAIPVSPETEGSDRFEVKVIESSPASVADYWGEYAGLSMAHDNLRRHQGTNGIVHTGPVIESYVTDPETVDSPNKVNTKVIYLHK